MLRPMRQDAFTQEGTHYMELVQQCSCMDVVCGIRLAEQLLKVGVVALDARCLDLKSVEDVKGNGW